MPERYGVSYIHTRLRMVIDNALAPGGRQCACGLPWPHRLGGRCNADMPRTGRGRTMHRGRRHRPLPARKAARARPPPLTHPAPLARFPAGYAATRRIPNPRFPVKGTSSLIPKAGSMGFTGSAAAQAWRCGRDGAPRTGVVQPILARRGAPCRRFPAGKPQPPFPRLPKTPECKRDWLESLSFCCPQLEFLEVSALSKRTLSQYNKARNLDWQIK